MKNILVFTLLTFLIFTSCQDEITELPTDQETETITANSEVAELIEFTALRDGSKDNIIDRANCSTIVLPVTVVVQGIEIIINSEEDFDVIERLYDKYEDDIDELDIIYPIKVILSDHSEVVIESADDLESIIAGCTEDDDDIECLDFEYPISISVFDANNEIAETKTFDSDKRLYHFFKELKENEFVSFNFPMGLIDAEGTKMNIENNNQLAEALRIAKNECDEDDDNDYNDDDFDLERLNNYLVTCPWKLYHVKLNNTDQTNQYNTVHFVFSENGTVQSKFSDATFEGTWETVMTDKGALIKVVFEELPDFSNDWVVYEIGEGIIKFYENDGNKIILKKTCEMPDPEFTTEEFVEAITSAECSWIVTGFGYNGDDVTAQYEGYHITFNTNGGVVATEGSSEITGEWSTQSANPGVFFLWDMNESLQELGNDWKLYEMSEDRMKFIANDNYIIIEKDCTPQTEFTSNDIEIIKDYVASSNWLVNNYLTDQVDNTTNFSGYQLNFNFDLGTVVATNGVDEFAGTWSIALDGDEMFMELNFADTAPFNAINKNWKVTEYSESVIVLGDGDTSVLKLKTLQ